MMRSSPLAIAFLTLAACLAAVPHGVNAAWGKTKDEDRVALMWVPEMRSVDWEAFRALWELHENTHLTLALSPAEIPEEVRPWLSDLAKEGRLEVALRISGDPILPLINRHRSRDAVDRIALARIQYRDIFGRFPDGLVAGDGALSPGLAQPLEMQRFKWAAVGDSAFRNPWYTSGESPMVVFPFHVPGSTEPVRLADMMKEVRAVVLSELNGPLKPGQGIEALTALFEEARGDRWTSVVKAIEYINPYAVGPEEWSSWSGDLALWTDHPLQKEAWRLYELTVRALDSYQNSGAASLYTLNRANTHLYHAQNSQFYRAENLHKRWLEQSFRSHLRKVFKTLGKKAPKDLLAPLRARGAASDSPETEDPGRIEEEFAAERAPEDETAVRGTLKNAALLFESPKGSSASLPKRLPELPPGTTALNLWTPHSLEVSWNEESVTLTMGVRELLKEKDAPNGYDALLLELYMDLNHLAGRGATALLPGRQGFLRPLDAWEYAIAANGWNVNLYRSVPGQPPELVESLRSETDLKKGLIRVSVARARLRGNPAGWGYVLLTLATDQDGALRSPPSPLPGENGSPLLGLMGPLDAQKELAESKSSYRRVGAVRLQER